MSTSRGSRNPSRSVVAGIVAVSISAGILALSFVNPYALIGLPPVLLAVAAIVRAVGDPRGGDGDGSPTGGDDG